MGERVFVTGGTGLIGRALVQRLIERGDQVVALARSDAAAADLAGVGADVARGDLLDERALAEGLRGSAVAYNVAGVNTLCPTDPAPLYRVNRDGARAMARAAAAAGVRRLVHTSSAATLGEAEGTIGREDSPHRGSFLSDYERSKFEAERAVLAAADETGIEVVSVNPASVQGPGRASGSTRLLLDYVNGRLKAVVDSTLSLIDITDCTTGHLLAATKGRPGERYVLSGATLTVREGLALLGRLAGIERPVRTLRPSLAMTLATVVESVAWVRRGSPRICRELARTITHGHAYDGSKAERELGLRYTPIEETLRRTMDWWIEQGLVAAPAARDPSSTS